MPAYKVFSHDDKPKVSVIIPSLDGFRGGNVEKLISDIKSQSFKSVEIILSVNEKPNGHARNVGSEIISKSAIVVCFFDDDIVLGNKRVIENFYNELKDNKIGLIGASQLAPKSSSILQKWISYDLSKASSNIKQKLADSEMVTHAGLACRVSVWKQYNGEDSSLVTGTDTDLRARLRSGGLRVAIAPNTFVFHPLPSNILTIFKSAKFHGIHQYEFRLKHGFQQKVYSPFIKVNNYFLLAFIILREVFFFIPHIFITNRKFFLGFRPINSCYRIIMVISYAINCYNQTNKDE